ncbi:hypothetical protein Tco_0907320 [Tanacetum coccineum]|uniref:Uncharacterized protein n=1 Tax=Tanacetum coccineum TaxID=301880 RepID=A0ABQ5CJ24_9ASTR
MIFRFEARPTLCGRLMEAKRYSTRKCKTLLPALVLNLIEAGEQIKQDPKIDTNQQQGSKPCPTNYEIDQADIFCKSQQNTNDEILEEASQQIGQKRGNLNSTPMQINPNAHQFRQEHIRQADLRTSSQTKTPITIKGHTTDDPPMLESTNCNEKDQKSEKAVQILPHLLRHDGETKQNERSS